MKSFLIVEDDEQLRDLYETHIRSDFKDVHIDHAGNGKTALEKALSIDYTAIIVDIHLPVLSGLEFYQELKKHSPALAKRTIFISGGINDHGAEFIFEDSLPHLEKPFSLEDFKRIISYVLTRETKKFRNNYGIDCKRKAIRARAEEKGTLTFLNNNFEVIMEENCKALDYSIEGVSVTYNKKLPDNGKEVFVSIEPWGANKKRGEILWTKHTGNVFQSGIKWL